MIFAMLCSAWALDPWETVESVRVRENFTPPTLEQRIVWTGLVADLVRHSPTGNIGSDFDRRASEADAELTRDEDFVVLASRRGHGVVAIRLGEASPLALVSPHPWYDLNTGRITSRTFLQSDARVALFATTHRRILDDAHAPESGLHAATLAVSQAMDSAQFVQIHGYGSGKTEYDVVVGGWGADRLSTYLGASLELHATTGVSVPKLAGRHNAQVQALAGRASTAHIELSKPARDRLLEDSDARDALVRGIGAWMEDAER